MSTNRSTTDQVCKAVCPPCNLDCDQGDTCPQRLKQFQPDFGIEHTRVAHVLTPLGYVLAIWAVLLFVIFVVRNA